MDRLHLMEVFIAVAEQGGFAGAARRMAMSPPAVTRCIAALEAHLQVKLFHRSTRIVRLTEAGQRYVELAQQVVSAADEADQACRGANTEPRGLLRVTAPVLFGRLYVMPGIIAYMRRYPAVNIHALFVDRVVNPLEEGIEVAFRIGELPDSSYRAIRVGTIRRVLCAAPSYLHEREKIEAPQDLAQHSLILSTALNPNGEINLYQNKRKIPVKFNAALQVSDNAAAISAAVDGMGIVNAASYQVADYISAGKLAFVLDDYAPPPLPVHILHGEGRYAQAKVKAFLQLMSERLRNALT